VFSIFVFLLREIVGFWGFGIKLYPPSHQLTSPLFPFLFRFGETRQTDKQTDTDNPTHCEMENGFKAKD
jgi:hypothetical protein